VIPRSPESCAIRVDTLFQSGSGIEDAASIEFTQAFFGEDQWICERVQSGMHSQSGRGGKPVEMERVIVDFHQYFASRLFDERYDSFFENPVATLFSKKVQ